MYYTDITSIINGRSGDDRLDSFTRGSSEVIEFKTNITDVYDDSESDLDEFLNKFAKFVGRSEHENESDSQEDENVLEVNYETEEPLIEDEENIIRQSEDSLDGTNNGDWSENYNITKNILEFNPEDNTTDNLEDELVKEIEGQGEDELEIEDYSEDKFEDDDKLGESILNLDCPCDEQDTYVGGSRSYKIPRSGFGRHQSRHASLKKTSGVSKH